LSSRIRVFTPRQRSRTFLNFSCPRNFPASFLASSCPMPIPAHECNVVPPILTEAMPVEAVTASLEWPRPPQTLMISRSKTDFPVPSEN
ncbi:hypothetical protein BU15DRAFT_42519, partial [Melanogaster broomeanus]